MQLTNHYMTITDAAGNIVHGKVVYVWAFMDGSVEVHITTSDWLDAGTYDAAYHAPAAVARGRYALVDYKARDGDWLIKGIFTRERAS